MKPETKFSKKVQDRLKEVPKTWFYKSQERSRRGIPDLIICCNGNMVAWELKVGRNSLSELQEYTIGQIRKAGGRALEVSPKNVDEAFAMLEVLSGRSY